MSQLLILTDTYKVLKLSEFSHYNNIEIDIGCGKGTFVLELAKKNTQTLFLAADIKLGRLRKLINKAKNKNINNLIALRTLALPLIHLFLPDTLLMKVHIICPDPWPKNKHRKHRMLTSQFFSFLQRKMKKNSYLHLATDSLNYEKWIRKNLKANKAFIENDKIAQSYSNTRSEFKNLWHKLGKSVNHWGYKLG